MKLDVNAVNILVDFSDSTNVETVVKNKEELFDDLNNLYKNEDKALVLLNNATNLDAVLNFKSRKNFRERNYVKVSSCK